MATLSPTNLAEFASAFNRFQKRGPLRSSTVGLPSYSQVFPIDSVLSGPIANPVVITGSGASGQSPLGSIYDTGQNIMGFGQDMRGLSLFNQGQQAAMTADSLYPIQRQNAELALEFLKEGQKTDANRQKQINSAIEKAALAKQGMAAAQTAANQFGGLQLTRNV